jgi:hypothetical protein
MQEKRVEMGEKGAKATVFSLLLSFFGEFLLSLVVIREESGLGHN